VVARLGRLDEHQKDGAIESLVEGLARYAEQAQVTDVAQDFFAHAAKEYGPVLVFKRLWEELWLGEFLSGYVSERGVGVRCACSRPKDRDLPLYHPHHRHLI